MPERDAKAGHGQRAHAFSDRARWLRALFMAGKLRRLCFEKVPHNLARPVARQRVELDKVHGLRDFILRDPTFAELDNLIGCERGVGRHHKDDRHLTPLWIWPPDDDGVSNAR